MFHGRFCQEVRCANGVSMVARESGCLALGDSETSGVATSQGCQIACLFAGLDVDAASLRTSVIKQTFRT